VQPFVVSLVIGIVFPVGLPIGAEFGLTNHVLDETWALTGMVYAVAVGMVSRNQAVAIPSFVGSVLCALIYSAEKIVAPGHDGVPLIQYGSHISIAVIYLFSLCYLLERAGRHLIDGEPFLEF
jgi:hypothetical protein